MRRLLSSVLLVVILLMAGCSAAVFDDPMLTDITLPDGLELDPPFTPEESIYKVEVETEKDSIEIKGVAAPELTVEVSKDTEPVTEEVIELDVGPNLITFDVTDSKDYSKTYYVEVTRKPDEDLSADQSDGMYAGYASEKLSNSFVIETEKHLIRLSFPQENYSAENDVPANGEYSIVSPNGLPEPEKSVVVDDIRVLSDQSFYTLTEGTVTISNSKNSDPKISDGAGRYTAVINATGNHCSSDGELIESEQVIYGKISVFQKPMPPDELMSLASASAEIFSEAMTKIAQYDEPPTEPVTFKNDGYTTVITYNFLSQGFPTSAKIIYNQYEYISEPEANPVILNGTVQADVQGDLDILQLFSRQNVSVGIFADNLTVNEKPVGLNGVKVSVNILSSVVTLAGAAEFEEKTYSVDEEVSLKDYGFEGFGNTAAGLLNRK